MLFFIKNSIPKIYMGSRSGLIFFPGLPINSPPSQQQREERGKKSIIWGIVAPSTNSEWTSVQPKSYLLTLYPPTKYTFFTFRSEGIANIFFSKSSLTTGSLACDLTKTTLMAFPEKIQTGQFYIPTKFYFRWGHWERSLLFSALRDIYNFETEAAVIQTQFVKMQTGVCNINYIG